MKPTNNTDTTPQSAKLAWHTPAISYIDIKRTMNVKLGSVTDSQFTGSATSDQN